MGKLYLIGNGIIKRNGTPVINYEFKENEEIVLEFIPFASSNMLSVPYAVSIRIEDNELTVDSDLITVIKWHNDYELRFKPMLIDSYEPPKSLAQNAVYTPEGDITVTVYRDSKTRIVIEGPGIFQTHTALINFGEPDIRMNQVNNKTIVAVTGTHDELLYLIIIMITKQCRILYEDVAEEITYNQNNIKLSRNLKDMKGRTIHLTLSYDGTSYKEISRSYECTYDHKYKSALLPYALLEAIMAGDLEDAKSYLDSSLDIKGLKEFFGDIVEILEPRYNTYPDNTVAVISGKGNNLNSTVYQFVIEKDKITNIIEYES